MFSAKTRFNLSMLALVLACVWYGLESGLEREAGQEQALMFIVLNFCVAMLNYWLWGQDEKRKERKKDKNNTK